MSVTMTTLLLTPHYSLHPHTPPHYSTPPPPPHYSLHPNTHLTTLYTPTPTTIHQLTLESLVQVKEWFVHGKKMFNVIFSSQTASKKTSYANILSYHPAKDTTTMRIVHMHFLRLKINKNRRKLNYYTQELKATKDNIQK